MSKANNLNRRPNKASVQASDGLTCIPRSIHCPATQTSGGSSNHELNDIAIEHFLDTLAEVALSIAAREFSRKQEENEAGNS